MSFSALTLNLWNVNEPLEARYSALASGLKLLRPDIVCLQEVSPDPRSARSQSELVAEFCNLAHCVEQNELSILCRYPIVRSSSAALPDLAGDGPRHVLIAELLVERRPLVVANTHLAYPSEMTEVRKAQVEALLAAIKHHGSADGAGTKILCGDFNDVPDSAPVRLVLNSEDRLHDVYAECCPNSLGFTYSRSNPYVDPSSIEDQRIDYVFVTDDLAPKDCSVVFDGKNGLDFASDHFGVFCSLDFR